MRPCIFGRNWCFRGNCVPFEIDHVDSQGDLGCGGYKLASMKVYSMMETTTCK